MRTFLIFLSFCAVAYLVGVYITWDWNFIGDLSKAEPTGRLGLLWVIALLVGGAFVTNKEME